MYEINIDEAAKILNVNPMDIYMYVLDIFECDIKSSDKEVQDEYYTDGKEVYLKFAYKHWFYYLGGKK